MINDAERYIEARRRLGYLDHNLARDIRKFAQFAAARGATHVRDADAFEWTGIRPGLDQRRKLLVNIRHMALYLKAEDSRHEVLPIEYVRKPRYAKEFRPYIFSDEEIIRILNALSSLPIKFDYSAATYRCIIGLIAATGIRLSEALGLTIEDVRTDSLLVRKGKFGKDRLVYLHSSTIEALEVYRRTRPARLKSLKLFVNGSDRTPAKCMLEQVFRRCTNSLGLTGNNGSGPPRIHDLRHTFAVNSLTDCGFDKTRVSNHIVSLSTHLGHVSVRSTYWYLQMAPEAKRAISRIMEGRDNG